MDGFMEFIREDGNRGMKTRVRLTIIDTKEIVFRNFKRISKKEQQLECNKLL